MQAAVRVCRRAVSKGEVVWTRIEAHRCGEHEGNTMDGEGVVDAVGEWVRMMRWYDAVSLSPTSGGAVATTCVGQTCSNGWILSEQNRKGDFGLCPAKATICARLTVSCPQVYSAGLALQDRAYYCTPGTGVVRDWKLHVHRVLGCSHRVLPHRACYCPEIEEDAENFASGLTSCRPTVRLPNHGAL